MKKFEVGKTYFMRSVGDYDCIWYCEILSRTAKFVTVKVSGYVDPVRVGIKLDEYRQQEECFPLGRYSMAPLLRAENEEGNK